MVKGCASYQPLPCTWTKANCPGLKSRSSFTGLRTSSVARSSGFAASMVKEWLRRLFSPKKAPWATGLAEGLEITDIETTHQVMKALLYKLEGSEGGEELG